MEEILKQILNRLDSLDNKMANLESAQKEHSQVLAGLEATQKEHSELLKSHSQMLAGLEATQKEHSERMSKLEESVLGMREEHGRILQALMHRAEVDGAILTRLEEDVQFLKGEVKELKTDLSTVKEKQSEIQGRLGSINSNMDFMMHKLIYHESDIYQLKRKAW